MASSIRKYNLIENRKCLEMIETRIQESPRKWSHHKCTFESFSRPWIRVQMRRSAIWEGPRVNLPQMNCILTFNIHWDKSRQDSNTMIQESQIEVLSEPLISNYDSSHDTCQIIFSGNISDLNHLWNTSQYRFFLVKVKINRGLYIHIFGQTQGPF